MLSSSDQSVRTEVILDVHLSKGYEESRILLEKMITFYKNYIGMMDPIKFAFKKDQVNELMNKLCDIKQESFKFENMRFECRSIKQSKKENETLK
jgi:hypothetical protein